MLDCELVWACLWSSFRPEYRLGGRLGSQRTSDPHLRLREDYGEIAAEWTARLVDVADSDFSEIFVEQVGPMSGAGHPPIEGDLRRVGGCVASAEDVLTDLVPVITLEGDSFTDAGAIRTRM